MGKPYIADTLLEFSLSKSRNRVVVATSLSGTVGVDIEFVRDSGVLWALAQRFFSVD